MIITDQEELTKLCEKLSAFPFITIDTEFLREKTYYPKLCLVQVSDPSGNAAAIDPIDGHQLDLTPLFDLFLNPKVLKVIHSGRQDLEIFYNLTGKVVTPFFDTQIAAMVCGYGDSIGYESLVRGLTGQSLDKSVQFTDWSKRPLSKRQIDYALGDVIYLAEIYQKLLKELEKSGRTEWVFEEEGVLANPATYSNEPEQAWERIKLRSPKPKMLAILKELAAWREKRAQDKNLPRSWVMRDETLADMAAQMPETVDQLKKIRGVTPDMASGHIGKTLLELVAKAADSDKGAWPKAPERKMFSPQATATIDILKMLLKIQAAENGVAAKLIADQEDIERMASEDSPDVLPLKGWRYEVFGREAIALKEGKIAVGLKNGKITKYEVGELK
ncbi:MAG: ribonuclease D [Alphaproteobacteria bacterium]